MKATIVTMTKQLAKDYLNRNVENRKIKKRTLNFYKNQMSKGNWKENGEPIIIDKNGVIRDGQHRLLAVVETDFSYRVPVISDVDHNVMDTIDTGTNRSAADVLEIEGFLYSPLLASLCKNILSTYSIKSTDSAHNTNVSNGDILRFANNKKQYLQIICKEAMNISSLQVVRVLAPSMIGYYIYTYGNTEETKTFLKHITGTLREPKTATDYVYKKLMLAKNGDIRLSAGDKQKYIEKAYFYYVKGNNPISFIRI